MKFTICFAFYRVVSCLYLAAFVAARPRPEPPGRLLHSLRQEQLRRARRGPQAARQPRAAPAAARTAQHDLLEVALPVGCDSVKLYRKDSQSQLPVGLSERVVDPSVRYNESSFTHILHPLLETALSEWQHSDIAFHRHKCRCVWHCVGGKVCMCIARMRACRKRRKPIEGGQKISHRSSTEEKILEEKKDKQGGWGGKKENHCMSQHIPTAYPPEAPVSLALGPRLLQQHRHRHGRVAFLRTNHDVGAARARLGVHQHRDGCEEQSRECRE